MLALFTMSGMWKPPKPINRWLDTQNAGYAGYPFFSREKEGNSPIRTAWMGREDIIPSERNRPGKDKYSMILQDLNSGRLGGSVG